MPTEHTASNRRNRPLLFTTSEGIIAVEGSRKPGRASAQLHVFRCGQGLGSGGRSHIEARADGGTGKEDNETHPEDAFRSGRGPVPLRPLKFSLMVCSSIPRAGKTGRAGELPRLRLEASGKPARIKVRAPQGRQWSLGRQEAEGPPAEGEGCL